MNLRRIATIALSTAALLTPSAAQAVIGLTRDQLVKVYGPVHEEVKSV